MVKVSILMIPTVLLSLFHTMDRHNIYTTMLIQPPVPMPFCAMQTQTFSSRITTSKEDTTTAKL